MSKDANDIVMEGGELLLLTEKRNEKWAEDLLLTAKGNYKTCYANVISILFFSDDWKGCLTFNEWRQDIEMARSPPWFEVDAPRGFFEDACEWEKTVVSDSDITRIIAYMERAYQIHPSVDMICRALQVVAEHSAYHAVRDYLDGLEWDGISRLRSWIDDYCSPRMSGEECDSTGEMLAAAYTAKVGTWWMISAVARIFDPGCKVDHVLVFEGRQRIGKSSAFLTLCQDPTWNTDTPLAIGNKDAYANLDGTWIYELAEIDGIVGRKEITAVKAFITSPSDKYRPAYARVTVNRKRQVVFCGTANRYDYLRDETGNRRYWPIYCCKIDLQGLGLVRDQLWAEAVARYQSGEQWFPSSSEEHSMCEEQQAMRRENDVWEEDVFAWTQQKEAAGEHITIPCLFEEVLHLDTREKQTKRIERRLSSILRGMGYIRSNKQVTITRKGRTRRIRPYVKEV